MTDSSAIPAQLAALESQLDSFDASERASALCSLAELVGSGDIRVPMAKQEVNLHFHTFFSYNAKGWSPSRIAWEACKHGLLIAGIVDFDVLDGMEEFLAAGEILNTRTAAAVETRIFVREYSEKVINSPNEPGISYFMIAGCYRTPDPGTPADDTLRLMRSMAERRNTQVIERVNSYLDSVQLDYEEEVMPLTPSGNATERHMVAAYDAQARRVYDDAVMLAEFWAKSLEITREEATRLLADTPMFHEKIRNKLMKHGGVGYIAPTPGSFPTVEQVVEVAKGIEAIPTATWLDGTSAGESDMREMLQLMASKGVVALNIIPDRNWNIADPDEKKIKLAKLAEVIEAAREVHFPICVGTEMNKAELPFVDNFAAPELAPYLYDFIDGAYFFWGHTVLARNAGMGYGGDWARHYFGSDRRTLKDFYTRAGRLISPHESAMIAGSNLRSGSPTQVLRALQR